MAKELSLAASPRQQQRENIMGYCLGWAGLNGKQKCTQIVHLHWRTTRSHMQWLLDLGGAMRGIDDFVQCWWVPEDKTWFAHSKST